MKQKTYTREALLRSRRFAGYQQDFLKAVLSEPTYTMAEALQRVTAFFGRRDA